MLVDKAAIRGSSLLSVVTSLFEKTAWDSPIKSASASTGCPDVHLSIIGCCTTDTYEHLWTSDAIAIGLTNRLFVVTSDARAKKGFPREDNEHRVVLDEIRNRIESQLSRCNAEDGLTIDLTPDAEAAWNAWYEQMPETESARRLETVGYRLLALIGLITDKTIIDMETVNTVCQILDYEYTVRMLTDPIDADLEVAKLEEKIRRVLDRFADGLDDRSIRQKTNANRKGLWAYDAAKKNLIKHGDIWYEPRTGLYHQRPSSPEPATQPMQVPVLRTVQDAQALYKEYRAWLKAQSREPKDHSFADWLDQRSRNVRAEPASAVTDTPRFE